MGNTGNVFGKNLKISLDLVGNKMADSFDFGEQRYNLDNNVSNGYDKISISYTNEKVNVFSNNEPQLYIN